ncbi:hypothetical protein [Halopseudomonas xinjiangensis]|uniref:hypothetical protein n=1 Tax=Halopseudomonas xinjiangensis TaxID=487184 RepID=UPI000B814050|nr:hypothetical protein [Halopseudomonas xinjiangensis]
MLWKRSKPQRCFAQLDASGRCIAFWVLPQPPASGKWMEVSDADPRWIGRQLHNLTATTLPARSARP